MAWAEPKHTRTRVDSAGKKFTELLSLDLLDGEQVDDFEEALEIINNWRSSHSYPLNTFQMGLRRTVRHLGSKTPWLVAQRIKRLPAISLKLKLNKSMQLSQMQDIGGCRAVVSTVRQVNELVALYKASSMKHELVRVTDYIEKPRNTGYRSVHLMYRYHSDKNKTAYNGLRIEMQLRSRLQHAWATAVETVGEFIGQALKSNVGQAPWLRFFQLMGSAIAIEEKTPLVPGTPTNSVALRKELRTSVAKLNVLDTLRSFGNLIETRVSTSGAELFLLETNPMAKSVQVTGFARAESEKAMARYAEIEKSFISIPGAQVVLVSVDSIDKLRRAYPSYFLESSVFIKALGRALRADGPQRRRRRGR